MEGELGRVPLETGDAVTAGEPLSTISAPTMQIRNEAIGDARAQSDLAQESSRLGAELSASLAEKARYDQMFGQYTGHRADDLQSQVREAQTDVATSQAKAQSTAAEVRRDQQALTDHLIPRSTLDTAQDKADTAQRDVESKTAVVRRLQKQVVDARSGFSDTGSEPSFVSARNNAATQAERLRAEKNALDVRIQQMSRGGAVMPVVNAQPSTAIDSPVSVFIWSRLVATGQSVRQGDNMFRIADAHSIHVEVWLDRRYGPQLSIGDNALVYLNGMGKELQGRVTSFEGTSRRTNEEEINAIDLQAVHPDQYHGSIELQQKDRKAEYIGQAAKVLFPGAKHPLRADIYFWLTRL